jgi:MFS family permease
VTDETYISAEKREPERSVAYRTYVLASLTLLLTINFLDRGLIVLFLQSIKVDLHLSDTELGCLTGMAFGSFYALLGIPIARWADRGNRVLIASSAIALWGMTATAFLWIRSFTQLIILRVVAAVGESGCLPPTYSLVGDYFHQPKARTQAMTVYWLSSPLSVLISFIVGGQLSRTYNWRDIFFLMGVPAVIASVVIALTVFEPRSKASGRLNTRGATLRMIGRDLWQQMPTRHISLAIVLLCTMGAGMSPWYGAFMIRNHDMTIEAVGTSFGIIFGLSGIVGVLAGGYVAARWFENDDGRQMKCSAIVVALLVPLCATFLLAKTAGVALMALVPITIVTNFFFGPTFSLLQRLVADDARATTIAIVMTFANLIGMGVGPQLVGALSDALRPVTGPNSLRYAMLGISLVAWWSAYHFWQAGTVLPRNDSPIHGRAGLSHL